MSHTLKWVHTRHLPASCLLCSHCHTLQNHTAGTNWPGRAPSLIRVSGHFVTSVCDGQRWPNVDRRRVLCPAIRENRTVQTGLCSRFRLTSNQRLCWLETSLDHSGPFWFVLSTSNRPCVWNEHHSQKLCLVHVDFSSSNIHTQSGNCGTFPPRSLESVSHGCHTSADESIQTKHQFQRKLTFYTLPCSFVWVWEVTFSV